MAQVAVKLLLGPAASLVSTPDAAAEALMSLSNPMLVALREVCASTLGLRHIGPLGLP